MQEREVVLTKREVEARLVPSGTEIMIPADTFVTITQSLGGTFTVAVNGNLARIEGHDADALGKQPLESSFETPCRPPSTWSNRSRSSASSWAQN